MKINDTLNVCSVSNRHSRKPVCVFEMVRFTIRVGGKYKLLPIVNGKHTQKRLVELLI